MFTTAPSFFVPLRLTGCCFLLLFMLLTACKKASQPGQLKDDQLVILAEITAGDTVEVPVGKTIRAGGGDLIGFQKVNDAVATLVEGKGQMWTLSPNWSPQYAANPTTVFTSRRRFKADSTYVIEVRHPVLGTATASTYIPSLPRINHIDTLEDIYQGRPVLAATITWQDDPGAENYYVIEALKELLTTGSHFFYQGVRYSLESQAGKTLYERIKNTPGVRLYRDTLSQNKFLRLNLYTHDAGSENDRIDNLANAFHRVFFSDQNFNGSSHTTVVYIDRQFFMATDLKQKGRVLLQVKSVSKGLFDYLMTYEIYKTDFGTLISNRVNSPVGNVQNGVGIFGGSAKKERVYYFDPL